MSAAHGDDCDRDQTGMPVRDGTSTPVWRDGTSTPVWRDGTSTPARWDGTSTPARPDEPAQLPHGSAGPAEPAQPQGLAWWWEIDLDALLGGLNADSPAREGAQPTCPQPEEDQEAMLAAELAARDRNTARTVPAGEVAGRVAERLSPGPGLAALLSGVPAAELSDHDLPAVAAGFRRIASWAQASELSAVAQIACRTAAKDSKIGMRDDGCPARIGAGAAAQVSLALAMSGCGAFWWTDLAVTLTWRLAATGAALAAGDIDLPRARMIAEATSMLDEDAARAVQDKVLPAAGDRTTAQLRRAAPGGNRRRP